MSIRTSGGRIAGLRRGCCASTIAIIVGSMLFDQSDIFDSGSRDYSVAVVAVEVAVEVAVVVAVKRKENLKI